MNVSLKRRALPFRGPLVALIYIDARIGRHVVTVIHDAGQGVVGVGKWRLTRLPLVNAGRREVEQVVNDARRDKGIAAGVKIHTPGIRRPLGKHLEPAGLRVQPRNKIVALDIGETLEDIGRKLMHSQHSRFPVTRNTLDNVLGVVRTKDLLNQRLNGEALDLLSLLRPALFLPENTSALEVLTLFKEKGTHLGLVLDEFGGIQGMVTHNDILEAIVGYDPSDETPAEPEIVQRADGSWLIDGMAPIADVTKAIDKLLS